MDELEERRNQTILIGTLQNIADELMMIRKALTLLTYYTSQNTFEKEASLAEVKELIECI
jgi:soluble P-type ATPase